MLANVPSALIYTWVLRLVIELWLDNVSKPHLNVWIKQSNLRELVWVLDDNGLYLLKWVNKKMFLQRVVSVKKRTLWDTFIGIVYPCIVKLSPWVENMGNTYLYSWIKKDMIILLQSKSCQLYLCSCMKKYKATYCYCRKAAKYLMVLH